MKHIIKARDIKPIRIRKNRVQFNILQFISKGYKYFYYVEDFFFFGGLAYAGRLFVGPQTSCEYNIYT